jgi:hypothetical protein
VKRVNLFKGYVKDFMKIKLETILGKAETIQDYITAIKNRLDIDLDPANIFQTLVNNCSKNLFKFSLG